MNETKIKILISSFCRKPLELISNLRNGIQNPQEFQMSKGFHKKLEMVRL